MSTAGEKWRWDAEEYARSSSAQKAWALELIDKLGLTGNETVLDIGCGDGKVTAEIARRLTAGSVMGVDSSEDMIRMSRSSFSPAEYPNLSFQLADARALPFTALFDVAFSNATLHWVKDHGEMLRGVARALKPGGRLLFQMGGKGNGAEIFAVAEEMTVSDRWKVFFKNFKFPWGFYGPEEYAPWCRDAGLRVRRIELLPRDMAQKGADGLAGWVRTTWMPYTGRVPEQSREAFIKEACDRYIALHPPDARGNVTVRMARLEVEAEKP
ncbi:MAG: methyltransferase domain-containing protein [Spirochaetia bacterium]|jgi:trans-aconitate methyltransferase